MYVIIVSRFLWRLQPITTNCIIDFHLCGLSCRKCIHTQLTKHPNLLLLCMIYCHSHKLTFYQIIQGLYFCRFCDLLHSGSSDWAPSFSASPQGCCLHSSPSGSCWGWSLDGRPDRPSDQLSDHSHKSTTKM